MITLIRHPFVQSKYGNHPSNKYMYMFLGISFGVCYGIASLFMFFPDFIVPLTGELTLMHPFSDHCSLLTFPCRNSYLLCDGRTESVQRNVCEAVPRKQDLFWIPLIIGISIIFASSMHFGSLLFGIPVPELHIVYLK